MSQREQLLEANARYAASFTGGELPMPPGRRFAVLTCMDARLDPARFLGLQEGDAHVIRNAGGLANDDAIRSLVISQRLLGTEEVFVIAHSDCGMRTFSNEELREKLREEANADAEGIDFGPFSDSAESVRASLARIRQSSLLQGYAAAGFVFDNQSGGLPPSIHRTPWEAGSRSEGDGGEELRRARATGSATSAEPEKVRQRPSAASGTCGRAYASPEASTLVRVE